MEKEAVSESSQDWFAALELSKKELKKWQTRGEKIVKRYRDDREEFGGGRRYNILWSNIRTLMPAVYSKKPKAECSRRHKDADPVGRCAAQVLERALQYEIDHYSDFDSAIRHAVLDRLLPGRGVAWVRYEPSYTPGQPEDVGETQITDDVEPEMADTLESECSPVDYVFWKDFAHSPARTWEEVTWVARRVYMAKEEGKERFGEAFKDVPMAHEPVGLDELKRDGINADSMKKAIVWEIWDKPTKTAIWVAEGCQTVLDEKPDPLKLDTFFPCPKPLFSTMTSDSLVPVADYVLYQDQARELDEITARIGKLVEAVKVVGVYDASQVGVQRMLSEGVDNTLIPIDTWAAFGEKGGLKGTVDFLPLDVVVGALSQMYAAREQVKQVIYEVTGLSDIIRGASVASETATAQQIKSQYASLRLKEMQSDVARFASDILRIKAQIMCSYYSPETLVTMSGMQATPDAVHLEAAIQLLQNDTLRAFRIEVETDSLVELDEAQEKSDRMEFLTAASGFVEKAIQAPPELAPLLGEMLMFGVRSFKAGKGMEASLEQFIQAAAEKAKQPPQQPPPDPEMLKLQATQQAEQGRMQLEQAKMQASQQLEQAKMEQSVQLEQGKFQLEQAKMQAAQQLEEMRMAAEQSAAQHKDDLAQQQLEFERWKAELDARVKLRIAQIGKEASGDELMNEMEDEIALTNANPMDKLAEMHMEMMQVIGQLAQNMNAPKAIVRDANGKAIGVQAVQS